MIETTPSKARYLGYESAGVIAGAAEPVRLDQAKNFFGLSDRVSKRNLDVMAAISSARRFVERETGQILLRQSLIFRWAGNTGSLAYALTGRGLKLFATPFVEITAVASSYEGANTTETLSGYYVTPGLVPRLRRKDTTSFAASSAEMFSATVTMGHSVCPKDLYQAVLVLAREYFDNPASYALGVNLSAIPNSVQAIIAANRQPRGF